MKRTVSVLMAILVFASFLLSACSSQSVIGNTIEKIPINDLDYVFYSKEQKLFHSTDRCPYAESVEKQVFAPSKLDINYYHCYNCVEMVSEPVDNGDFVVCPNERARRSITVYAGISNKLIVVQYPATSSDSWADAQEKLGWLTVMYIEAGQSVELPEFTNRARVFYCSGKNWYGKNILFGENTNFAELDGTGIYNTIGLRSQDGMNLDYVSAKPISRSEFLSLIK